jgi:hypothetical protein
MKTATNKNKNKKKTSTKAHTKWDKNRSVPYPWKAGYYFCFAPNNEVVMKALQERQAMFTMSCREHVPAPTTAEAEEYIPGCSSIVKYYREELGGGQFAPLVNFGFIVPAQEPYVIVGPFGHHDTTLRNILNEESGPSPMQSHPWMHMLFVT